MNEDRPIVKLKLDIIFKRIFGDEKNADIIAAMLSALLEIPRDSIREIEIQNVELPPEALGEKFSRLDLKLNVDGRIVNVEMQVNYEPDFCDRTLFYWSKMFSEGLKTGDLYGSLRPTYCINIIHFNLFDCEAYHSHFQVMECERHDVLSDKFGIHFFELKKLGSKRQNNSMEDWLRLINAETEGELMEIQKNTAVPEVRKTIGMLRHLSGDEKVRQEAYYREKRLHDEANAILGSRREGEKIGFRKGMAEGRAEGRAEGEQNMKSKLTEKWRAMGMTEEQIQELLGD